MKVKTTVRSTYGLPGVVMSVSPDDYMVKHYLKVGVLEQVDEATPVSDLKEYAVLPEKGKTYNDYKVPELQADLRRRGLDDSGLKAALIERLTADDDKAKDPESAVLAPGEPHVEPDPDVEE